MGQLQLSLLGSPEIRHTGQLLKFPTRKTLALLVYLALAEGLQPRETLTALFWPESSQEQGRAALRNTLTYLRKALDDRVGPHLIIEREALGLDFGSGVELDVRQLAAALQAGEARPGLLGETLKLYRGDFLAGFSLEDAPDFENWATLQREHWHRQIDRLCDLLSRQQLAVGVLPEALQTLTRWLQLNPLHELIYQRLMQLHLAAGDREAARRVYGACRTMLAAEFGVEPGPETLALAEMLSRPMPLAASAPSSIVPLPLELPLAGRSSEYLKLVELYYITRRGESHLVVLEGEAGIGKSRLAAEFLQWAAAQGADIVRGRAFETGGRLPYQPIAEAWRERLERENAPEDWLADVWLAELSRLLPELRERYPDLPPPAGDEAGAQSRLFEATARLGLALAQKKPLLFFVDDVQWADAASLDLLHYTGRRWTESGAPILLFLTVRIEALAPPSELALWLARLGRDCQLSRLALSPLRLAETRQLLQSLAGPVESAEAGIWEQLGERLFQETGGQPFFLTETLNSLLDNGLLSARPREDGSLELHLTPGRLARPDWQEALRLPPGVRDVIRARLAQLTPGATAMLAAGAVLGQNFTFEQLCRVAELSETEGLPALDELLARHLFQHSTVSPPLFPPSEGGPGGGGLGDEPPYSFSHDKIRDVAYTEAGDTRRRIFHRRALAVLEAEGAPPAALAHHALLARQPEAAFRYSLAAGEAAMGLFAVRDALLHYEQARQAETDIRNRVPAAPPLPDVLYLYLQLGRAYELNSQLEQARTTYQTLLALTRQARQAEMECKALNRLATLAAQANFDLATSRKLLQEAQQVAESGGDKIGLGETEWNLAQIGLYSEDPDSLKHGWRALALARELGLDELIARCLNVTALGCSLLGQWQQMEDYGAEAAALYADLGNRAMQADCLGLVGNARTYLGRPRAGVEAGRQALAIAQEIGNVWGQVTASIHLVEALVEAGEYAEALSLAEEAVKLAQAQGLIMVPYIMVRLGTAQRALLDLEAACATHKAALAANEALSSQPFVEMINSELCADYGLRGEWQTAYHHARQAQAARTYKLLNLGLSRWYETEALLRGGEADLARKDAQHFGALIEDPAYGNHNPRFHLPYLRSLAVLALATEATREEGLKHLEEAYTLAETMALPGEQWLLLAKLAEVYQAGGAPAKARQALDRAREVIQMLAAKLRDETLRQSFLVAAEKLLPR